MRSLWLQLVWNQAQVAPTKVYLVFLHLPSVLLHYGLVSWSTLAYDLIAIYKLNDANPLRNEGEMRRMNFEYR